MHALCTFCTIVSAASSVSATVSYLCDLKGTICAGVMNRARGFANPERRSRVWNWPLMKKTLVRLSP